LASPVGKVPKEFPIRDRGLAILCPAAWWLRPLRGRWLTQPCEFVQLRVDIHERILVIMRAHQEDSGGIVCGECNHYSKHSGEMRYADSGEKIVAR
jgi:hypothetical protein